MGTSLSMYVSGLRIRKDKVESCLRAINEWAEESYHSLGAAMAVEGMLNTHADEDGNVVVDYFSGEKAYHEEDFFATIAPYVNDPAYTDSPYVDCEYNCGESHARFSFKEGKLYIAAGRVSYGEPVLYPGTQDE